MKFFVKKEVAELRESICKACDQLSEHSFCKQCGCYMPIKVKMGWVECPLKKWVKSDEHDPEQPVPELPVPVSPAADDDVVIVP